MHEYYEHRDGRICTPHAVGTKTEFWYDGNKVCRRLHNDPDRLKIPDHRDWFEDD